MELIEFAEQNVVIAKDQPQYRPMPAHVRMDDREGQVICCWQLSPEEIERLLVDGKIWHSILTFGGPVQPQMLSVDKPEFATPETVQ